MNYGAKIDRTASKIDAMNVKIEETTDTTHDKIDRLSTKVEHVQTSVSSTRSVAKQVFDFLISFSREAQETMRAIIQSNWQIYRILLEVQDRVAQTPTGLLNSNIKFENALGEYWEFPYEVFRHWEPFEAFLQVQFKEKPGEDKVRSGGFHIIDTGNQGFIINKERWTQSIERGTTLGMSMIVSHVQWRESHCARPDCPGAVASIDDQPGTLKCRECSITFSPTSDDLVGSFTRITVLEEDQEVKKRQAAEDLRLYGSRMEPPESIEVDEIAKLANLPSKRSASEFSAAVSRPAKVRKEGENKRYNYGPAVSATKARDPNMTKGLYSCDPRIQIYYRNIVDRYPALPQYLATRLAEANRDRAERLQQTRDQAKNLSKPLSDPRHKGLHAANPYLGVDDAVPSPHPDIGAPYSLIQDEGPPSPPGFWRKPIETTQTESETSFWSGKMLSSRPQSIKSASSSNNCSLRGSQVVDPEEQNLSVLKEISPTSSMNHSRMSPTLVPPPVKLGEGVSFTCDICGQIVTAARRLDWQKHALQDLRPYSCTYEACREPEKVYASRGEYLYHELVLHREAQTSTTVAEGTRDSIQYISKQSVLCPFCNELTGTGKNGRAAHIGRHMEEIAFTVCNTPYQEWDFYSDSSMSSFHEDTSKREQLRHPELTNVDPLQCRKINPANGRSFVDRNSDAPTARFAKRFPENVH
ncbi:MAG: hypothetical protein Q9221_003936 [Calogaya cf. arnoldii]